jgi:hypothetical protein
MNLIKEISQKIKYINFNNQIQINELINQLSLNNLENSISIDDPLYYINGPKKIINFVFYNKINRKFIPNSITKFDLYTIAYPKSFELDIDFVLIHKNKILQKDESSIDKIFNEDLIIIIEEKRYPDKSFYNSLIQKPGEKINISFHFESGKSNNLIFPFNITNSEFINIINEYYGFKDNSCGYKYNGRKIENNNKKIKFIDGDIILVESFQNILGSLYYYYYGKIIFGNIKSINIKNSITIKEILNKDLPKEEITQTIKTGILNSTR